MFLCEWNFGPFGNLCYFLSLANKVKPCAEWGAIVISRVNFFELTSEKYNKILLLGWYFTAFAREDSCIYHCVSQIDYFMKFCLNVHTKDVRLRLERTETLIVSSITRVCPRRTSDWITFFFLWEKQVSWLATNIFEKLSQLLVDLCNLWGFGIWYWSTSRQCQPEI